jgi:hypothetical protein
MDLGDLLPAYLALRGKIAVSIHDLDSSSPEDGPVGVFVSEEVAEGFFIRKVTLIPRGEIPLPMGERNGFPETLESSLKWLNPYFESSPSPIAPDSLYRALSRPAARKLLTGHLLAVLYSKYLAPLSTDTRPDIPEMKDRQFKFFVTSQESNLTKMTARNYRLLTEWLESSPLQVLSWIEGVRVVTIRNRLQAARSQGLLENPGPGKRRAKKS